MKDSKYLRYFFMSTALALLSLYLFYYMRIFISGDYMPPRADPIEYYLDAKAFFSNFKIYSPYVMDENASILGGAGIHGPFYQIFYGISSLVFGIFTAGQFPSHTMLYINLILLCLMVYLLYKNTILDLLSKSLILTFVLSYFICFWTSFEFMPEFLNIFCAFIIAIKLVDLYKKDEIRNKDILNFLLVVLISSLFRYSWVLTSIAIFAFVKNKKEFIRYALYCFTLLLLAFAYLKLFHAAYHVQVIGSATSFLKSGDLVAAFAVIWGNITKNLPLFFYKYFYSPYYFATKIIYVSFYIVLGYHAFVKRNKLALASFLVCSAYFISLFCFFDAFDTRDLRGLTGSMIIALVTLLILEIKWPVIISSLIFLFYFPMVFQHFHYMVYDKCVYAGEIFKKSDYSALKKLGSKGKDMITVLIPTRAYYRLMPGRQANVKNVLHSAALKLPTKNNQGAAIRYTRNNDGLDPYAVHNKMIIDYVLSPNGLVMPYDKFQQRMK